MLVGALVCGGALHVWGQLPASSPPPRHHSLSLEAQSVSNGGASRMTTRVNDHPGIPGFSSSGTVSETRVSKSQQFVEFTVRNFDARPDAVTVDWYFVAAPVSSNQSAAKEFVFDSGAQALAVPGPGTQTRTVSSKEADAVYKRATTMTSSSNSVSGNALNIGYANSQSGSALKGWFVRLIVDGRVIATKGSSQKYEEIAANDIRFKDLLGKAALPVPSLVSLGDSAVSPASVVIPKGVVQ